MANSVPGRSTSRLPIFSGTIRNIAEKPTPRIAWAVYVAEVAVDLTTYSVTVNDFVALQEVGQSASPGSCDRADCGRRRPGNRICLV